MNNPKLALTQQNKKYYMQGCHKIRKSPKKHRFLKKIQEI